MDYRASTSPQLIAADLAPGDAGAVDLDWSGLRIDRIRSPEHPLFRAAYERLWRYFGASGGMEREEVIRARFAWDPSRPVLDHALLYEMLVVRRGEEIVAVRDHSAILHLADGESGPVIVHLSHNLIEPALRGSGLAGWLRALPIQLARECAARCDAATVGCTLVAEMTEPDGGTDSTALRSYGRAGFLTIDPEVVPYCQPDFRAADEIERSSLRPVPFALVIRRVRRETERSLASSEARAIVSGLYTMFGVHARPDHMTSLWARLDRFPADGEEIALLNPSSP